MRLSPLPNSVAALQIIHEDARAFLERWDLVERHFERLADFAPILLPIVWDTAEGVPGAREYAESLTSRPEFSPPMIRSSLRFYLDATNAVDFGISLGQLPQYINWPFSWENENGFHVNLERWRATGPQPTPNALMPVMVFGKLAPLVRVLQVEVIKQLDSVGDAPADAGIDYPALVTELRQASQFAGANLLEHMGPIDKAEFNEIEPEIEPGTMRMRVSRLNEWLREHVPPIPVELKVEHRTIRKVEMPR